MASTVSIGDVSKATSRRPRTRVMLNPEEMVVLPCVATKAMEVICIEVGRLDNQDRMA